VLSSRPAISNGNDTMDPILLGGVPFRAWAGCHVPWHGRPAHASAVADHRYNSFPQLLFTGARIDFNLLNCRPSFHGLSWHHIILLSGKWMGYDGCESTGHTSQFRCLVEEIVSARRHRLLSKLWIRVICQHDECGRGLNLLYLSQHFDPIALTQLNIQDDNMRFEFRDLNNGLVAILRLTNHFHTV
jgi:hypothetical protein